MYRDSFDKGFRTFQVIVVFGAFVLLAYCFGGGCDDKPASRKALEKSGYTSIFIHDHVWFGCGHGDVSSLKFDAKNVNGERVEGVICCGIGKGCTVRF